MGKKLTNPGHSKDLAPTPAPEPTLHEVWSGVGALDHTYGHVWWHDDIATVSSWAGEGWQPSGMMQSPTGASAGEGYGVYSVTLQAYGTGPNVFACLWQADNVWGFEIDLVERAFDGSAYSSVHWKDTSGADQYTTYALSGIDVNARHTYSLDWRANLLIMSVDGHEVWRTTEHVPTDFAHGGVNAVLGVGEQPAWAAAYQTGDASVDVLGASYAVWQ